MWELYEDLIENIDPECKVTWAVCATMWTGVECDKKTLGLAMTTAEQSRPFLWQKELVGQSVKKIAKLVQSWNFAEASIGMAAINSYYNSNLRMESMHCRQPHTKFCTFDISLMDKTVGMVGHLRHPPETFQKTKELMILERNPTLGDYPDSACEYLLPKCDVIIITASSLINKTLPRLLTISKGKTIILVGPTTPMTPLLHRYGVTRLAGLIPNRNKIKAFVASGQSGNPYFAGKRFVLDSKAK